MRLWTTCSKNSNIWHRQHQKLTCLMYLPKWVSRQGRPGMVLQRVTWQECKIKTTRETKTCQQNQGQLHQSANTSLLLPSSKVITDQTQSLLRLAWARSWMPIRSRLIRQSTSQVDILQCHIAKEMTGGTKQRTWVAISKTQTPRCSLQFKGSKIRMTKLSESRRCSSKTCRRKP